MAIWFFKQTRRWGLDAKRFHLLQAEATSEGSHEYYNDLVSMLRARNEKNSFNLGVTVGVMYVEAGLKGSKETEFLTNMTKFQSQV